MENKSSRKVEFSSPYTIRLYSRLFSSSLLNSLSSSFKNLPAAENHSDLQSLVVFFLPLFHWWSKKGCSEIRKPMPAGKTLTSFGILVSKVFTQQGLQEYFLFTRFYLRQMSTPRRSAGDKKVLSMLFSSAVKQKSGYLWFLRQQANM